MPFRQPQRLQALPPYLFVDIDRKRLAAVAAGKDVINFGVGDPDQPTHGFIVERMASAIRNPAHHRYPSDFGAREFRAAAADFFQTRYGVQLDPARELLVLIGSKEGLGHLPLAVLEPGQVALVPDPGYPVYRAATIFAGGRPEPMPLNEEANWLPDFDALPAALARQAALLFLNYPNNPTGATATLDFFERAVAFARRHGLIIAQDAAYAELYLTDDRPPSILQVPSARDVAVEFHSLSKTFNMTGWRIGFAAGNAEVIAALARIKSNLDSGAFTAIQEAGIEAYRGIGRPEIAQMRSLYRQRAEILCAGLRQAGFRVRPPQATVYLWAGVPSGYDDLAIANRLLDEACIVCIPGVGFGQGGAGYVRFALTVDAERIAEAVRRLQALKW